MVILMSLTGGIVMFKVNMMAVTTTENGSLQDACSEILIQYKMQMTHESLSNRENSQNKLVVISKMIFLPGHHGVREGYNTKFKKWGFFQQ